MIRVPLCARVSRVYPCVLEVTQTHIHIHTCVCPVCVPAPPLPVRLPVSFCLELARTTKKTQSRPLASLNRFIACLRVGECVRNHTFTFKIYLLHTMAGARNKRLTELTRSRRVGLLSRSAENTSRVIERIRGLGEFSTQEKGIFNTRYHYISSYILVLSLCIMCIIILYLIHVYHVPRRHMIYRYIHDTNA